MRIRKVKFRLEPPEENIVKIGSSKRGASPTEYIVQTSKHTLIMNETEAVILANQLLKKINEKPN